jgi:signal transduction histidine kinase
MSVRNFQLPRHLRFDPSKGLIELAGARVMLFNQSAMASLHATLADQVGTHMSRMILARFGYESAVRDFKTLEDLFPDITASERLEIGPLMHSWSGIVGVEPEVTECDRDSGRFYFKGRWVNSYEAKLHLDQFGPSATPVCFSLAGYGSGWCSSWFGRPLLEVETKCVACGDPYCEWEIRPWDEWGPEADPWKNALSGTSRSIHRELETTAIELRKLNESMAEKVETRAKAQRDYLRVLCHDIEAPLRIARSEIAVSRHGGSGEELKSAERNLARVSAVVARAKVAALIEDGKVAVSTGVESVGACVLSAARNIERAASAKNIHLDVDYEEGLTAVIDPLAFTEQVLGNVLSNAVKFSPVGGVVTVRTLRDASGKVGVEIKDSGRGIPNDALERLFNPREVVSTAGTYGEQGSGYGLAIARSAMLAMNGSVEIESVTIMTDPLRHGTTVRLTLDGASVPRSAF